MVDVGGSSPSYEDEEDHVRLVQDVRSMRDDRVEGHMGSVTPIGRPNKEREMFDLLNSMPQTPEVVRLRDYVSWASIELSNMKNSRDVQMGYAKANRRRYQEERRKNWMLRLTALQSAGSVFLRELNRVQNLAATGSLAVTPADDEGRDTLHRLAFFTTCQEIHKLTGIDIEQVFHRSRLKMMDPAPA